MRFCEMMMSSGPNHRRGHSHIQDNGPTWEGGPPCSGCNSTHVARSRSKWKRRNSRSERRTGQHDGILTGPRVRPDPNEDWGEG